MFANGQETVDKTVATVSDGIRNELITYSDLVWQLALVPNVPLNPPSSADLNRALQLVISQRLIALEAQRLPREEPTDEEINAEIKRIVNQFPSAAEFAARLNSVGFKSADDDNFRSMIEERVAIEKYVDFRFRSFVVITPEEEKRYYIETYTPEFRKNNPERLLPPFDEVEPQIRKSLTERTVERELEAFLDDARDRSEITILSPV